LLHNAEIVNISDHLGASALLNLIRFYYPAHPAPDSIVVINVYKRFYLLYKNAFLTFFIFPTFFIKKTMNSQCENNGNLKHFVQNLKNHSAAHKYIMDFVLRFT